MKVRRIAVMRSHDVIRYSSLLEVLIAVFEHLGRGQMGNGRLFRNGSTEKHRARSK